MRIDNYHTEITNISSHGIWFFVTDEELFMSYEDFPWFKDQAVSAIIDVEQQGQNHFYWPALDVDLSLASIKNPERFPLISKQ